MKRKILIGSTIYQKPVILKYFLNSLSSLNTKNIDLNYLFIDDNVNNESSTLLEEFSEKQRNVRIINSNRKGNFNYVTDENTHHWNDSLVWKVAELKNSIIQTANEEDFDFLFLIDSDLILHPDTLNQLINSKKDIISNIFWTKWQPHLPELPQVWMFDEYEQYYKKGGEILNDEEKINRHKEFISKLRVPGVYEVGGLGACTLISKNAISHGVNFKEIKNVSFWGEDRHFCIRAQALGFDLFVDTNYPAYHLYRDSDLAHVENYLERTKSVNSLNDEGQIINNVIKGIEGLGSSKNSKDLNWKKYFSVDFIQLTEDLGEKENSRESQIKAIVCDIKINKINKIIKEANVEFLLVNEEYDENIKMTEKYNCNCYLKKIDGIWVITDLLITKNDINSYSNSNSLKAEKKNISIIYTNYSGSNSIALFKEIPTYLKELYNIELIKQSNEQDFYFKIINSDIVITTEGNFILDKKFYNPKQKVLELWHGFPIKAMGYQDKSENNINRVGKTWMNVDFISSYSNLFTEKMNECIKTDKDKFYITGAPRNDLLLKKRNKKQLSRILNKELISKKCLLYAPTFRYSLMKRVNEGGRTWGNIFDFKSFDNKAFSNYLKSNNLELIVKLHPAEEWMLSSIEKVDFVNFITDSMLEKNNTDLYELLGSIDILLTDYSSIYFDFLLLDKPIIFTPTDIEVYEQQRGLLFDYEEMTPGPKVVTQATLEKEISNYLSDEKYYKEERSQLTELIHCYKDDKSAERVWEFISTL